MSSSSATNTRIQVAVLTVSDTSFKDERTDKSGPILREYLSSQGFNCVEHAVVADDIAQIQRAITVWCKSGKIDWIVTTGGTGFGVRDTTPEAVGPLLKREASGLVHLMLSTSLKHTPLASLSRPVAGTIGNTLIVTLPGSPKAVKENITALVSDGVVNHAIELIKGGSGRATHASMSAKSSVSGGHSHRHEGSGSQHHHHGHDHSAPIPRTVLSHDPDASVTTRNRVSPFPLVSFEEAMRLIVSKTKRLNVVDRSVSPALRGHILAENVHAPSDIPSTYTTSVDGYALRSTDEPDIYPVVTSSSHRVADRLPAGVIYRINTGGPLPKGTDSVIMVEDTRIRSTMQNASGEDVEEKEIETLAQVSAGENTRAPGSDVKKGDLVLENGERITDVGGEIGTLAFVGRKHVKVYRKPIVAILSTGNEIVDLQTSLSNARQEWGGIWDTNRPSLHAALEGMGYEALDLGIVKDEIDAHVQVIQKGLDKADILLTTGGTSMGPTDLLKPVIERHFGGTIHFGRVTIKPGKPTTFGTIQWKGMDKPIFALPGNPASALVTFHIFVVPALRLLGGWSEAHCQLPRVQVQIQTGMALDTRTEFHRVIIRATSSGLKAFSTGGQRSSRVASLSGANGLIVLPQAKQGLPTRLEVGARAEAVIIGEIQMM